MENQGGTSELFCIWSCGQQMRRRAREQRGRQERTDRLKSSWKTRISAPMLSTTWSRMYSCDRGVASERVMDERGRRPAWLRPTATSSHGSKPDGPAWAAAAAGESGPMEATRMMCRVHLIPFVAVESV